jgi:hypothetical protein
MIVTVSHVRQAKYCMVGARRFFKRHNLDWSDFLRNGIEEDVLKQTGDAMALKVIEVARGR